MNCKFPKCRKRATCSLETANQRIFIYACEEHLLATINALAVQRVRCFARSLPNERIPKP